MRARRATLPLVVLAVLVLDACAGSPADGAASGRTAGSGQTANVGGAVTGSLPPSPLKTRAAYNAISSAHAPIWVTEEVGLFKKHGLDVDLQYIQGNNAYVALIAGETDFVFANAHNFVSLVAEGAEVRVLACLQPMVVDYAIMSTPEIRQASDLRGKIVAVSGGSDLTQAYFDEYFGRHGMRASDVIYIRTGGQPERAGAVRGGAAQATMLNTPTNVALEREGFRRLANVEELDLPTPARCITTRPEYLRDQPEIAERFVRAMIETAQYMQAHREEARAIVRARLKIEDDELMDATYFTAANNVRDPVVPLEGLRASAEALADENPRTLEIDLRKMIDSSTLDRVRQNGFIDTLYR